METMDESIIHFGGIRIRVNGVGNIKPSLYSLDRVRSYVMVPLPMQLITDIEPLRLCNFNSQRAILRLETNQINEIMKINRVIIYTKLIYTSYPG